MVEYCFHYRYVLLLDHFFKTANGDAEKEPLEPVAQHPVLKQPINIRKNTTESLKMQQNQRNMNILLTTG
jgi:hypothetical protein